MQCEILIVEDNLDDLFLFQEALAAAQFDYRLRHNNGGAGAASEVVSVLLEPRRPNILVLDYYVPAWTAPEFLEVLHASEALHGVQVIVLTGGISEDSTTALYQLGADLVIKKPLDLDGFLQLGVAVRDWYRDQPS